jgi:hypothetical protein
MPRLVPYLALNVLLLRTFPATVWSKATEVYAAFHQSHDVSIWFLFMRSRLLLFGRLAAADDMSDNAMSTQMDRKQTNAAIMS